VADQINIQTMGNQIGD